MIDEHLANQLKSYKFTPFFVFWKELIVLFEFLEENFWSDAIFTVYISSHLPMKNALG